MKTIDRSKLHSENAKKTVRATPHARTRAACARREMYPGGASAVAAWSAGGECDSSCGFLCAVRGVARVPAVCAARGGGSRPARARPTAACHAAHALPIPPPLASRRRSRPCRRASPAAGGARDPHPQAAAPRQHRSAARGDRDSADHPSRVGVY
eukprot:4847200-Prymnesium_polylepis.1